MDLATVTFLGSERGRVALAAVRATRGQEPLARRRALEDVMPAVSAAEARAVLSQDDLRVRAAAKTPLADALLFTKEALEQATPSEVAAERARRFAAFASVADLGAGVGLDTIALAAVVPRVVAVERDAVRAAILRENVAAAGVADRVEVVLGDATTASFEADAAFLDPDRRPGGARTRRREEFEPSPAAWTALAQRYRNLLVKLPPVTRPDDEPGRAVEWVSLYGEMKEARVGFGALEIATPRRDAGIASLRRALLLPDAVRVEGDGRPWPEPRAPAVGDVLLDPDPAVVLAGLVGDAAVSIDARPVHARIAYLLAATAAPWATSMRVLDVMPADPATIRRRLDERGAGDVEVLARGVEAPAVEWRQRIGAKAGPRGTIVVTRGADDRYVALLVERIRGA